MLSTSGRPLLFNNAVLSNNEIIATGITAITVLAVFIVVVIVVVAGLVVADIVCRYLLFLSIYATHTTSDISTLDTPGRNIIYFVE